MANYNPSTRARVADLIRGMQVDTGIKLNSASLAQTQQEDFNIYGRILLMNLMLEATTDFAADATLFQYTYSSAGHTPAIVSTKLGLVSLSVASITIGGRVYWTGGAVGGTTHVLTNLTGGISDLPAVQPMIVGYKDGVGTIGHLTTVATQASGAGYHSLFYVPMSDGAYVEAI